MTIKKIGLSVAAAMLVATASYAGTITNTDSVGLIGQEALSLSDLAITGAFGANANSVVYTPTAIPATSLKNPIFVYTFSNSKSIVVNDSNLSVFECQDGNESNLSTDNWRQVAADPQVSGDNSEIISFNAVNSDIYAYNNKKYIVAHSDGTDISDANVSLSVVKGSTSDVKLQAELYSGDSQTQTDVAAATSIDTIGNEYTGAITQKYDARINAADSFKSFYDRWDANALNDQMIFTLTRNLTVPGASLGEDTADGVVTFDQNLTVNGYQAGFGDQYDTNVTLPGLEFGDEEINLGLTVDGNVAIPKTVFDLNVYVTKTDDAGVHKFNLIPETTGNAGEWAIYGYNAQIPNVASTSDVDVTMKFTNRSSLNTNIYFTLIDPDGTIATLDSVNYPDSLPSLPANTTGVYKASTLVSLITDPEFDKTGSFSVEVSIPTTPSSVYGMASFKNLTLGQFKDLPVYNTSSMTY